jgi:hypothetical protein
VITHLRCLCCLFRYLPARKKKSPYSGTDINRDSFRNDEMLSASITAYKLRWRLPLKEGEELINVAVPTVAGVNAL